MRKGPVTIIGGGIVGLCCARQLQRDGIQVTIIDRDLVESRCSFGNAGSLSPGSVAPLAMPGLWKEIPGMLLDPLGPLYVRPTYSPRALPWLARFLASASPDRVEQSAQALRALLGSSIEALNALMKASGGETLIIRSGQLQLYPNRAAYENDAASWDLRRSNGVRVETVTEDEIRQLEPDVGSAYKFGVLLPDEGMVTNPQRQLEILRGSFVEEGGQFEQGNVLAVEVESDDAVAIRLDSGVRRASTVVIAAGVFSRSLAKQLGSPVPLESQRGYHIMIADAGITLRRPVVAADRKVFATPLEGGLRLAGTVEFAGTESPPDQRRARALLDHGKRLFPRLNGRTTSHWAGHRPCLPDSLPVIGRSPCHRNVIYAFGHGHLGLTGAAPTSVHVADLICGRAPAIDLTPFRIDRF
jgi:glycine/D-amino acid oxidase-like deaminating enzyme